MKEVFSTIKDGEKEYAIVFNLNVMEAIQAEYETLEAWGAMTDGKAKDGDEVDVKALIFGMREMINEGIEINNEKTGVNEPLLTHKQVGRILSRCGIESVTDSINEVVIASSGSDEKNV